MESVVPLHDFRMHKRRGLGNLPVCSTSAKPESAVMGSQTCRFPFPAGRSRTRPSKSVVRASCSTLRGREAYLRSASHPVESTAKRAVGPYMRCDMQLGKDGRDNTYRLREFNTSASPLDVTDYSVHESKSVRGSFKFECKGRKPSWPDSTPDRYGV